MTENRANLTVSQINYLVTMNRLDSGVGIRCVDIAKALCVSKPSVYTMMKTFTGMRYVKKTRYGTVHLSEDGKKTAECYHGHLVILSAYFENRFNLTRKKACSVSLSVLAALSADDADMICRQIHKTEKDKTGFVR